MYHCRYMHKHHTHLEVAAHALQRSSCDDGLRGSTNAEQDVHWASCFGHLREIVWRAEVWDRSTAGARNPLCVGGTNSL